MCSILYKKRKCFILCKPIQKKSIRNLHSIFSTFLLVENTNITPWFYPPVLMFHTVSVLKTKTLLHGSITIFASLKMKDIRLFVLLNHKHSFCIIHTVIGLWSNDICRLHHSNFTMKSYSRQNKYHDARAN